MMGEILAAAAGPPIGMVIGYLVARQSSARAAAAYRRHEIVLRLHSPTYGTVMQFGCFELGLIARYSRVEPDEWCTLESVGGWRIQVRPVV